MTSWPHATSNASVGRTPRWWGIGANDLPADSNQPAWLRLLGATAVRLFAGTGPLTRRSSAAWGDGVHNKRSFGNARRKLRTDEVALNASAASFRGALAGALQAAEQSNLAVLLVLQIRKGALPIAEKRGTQQWADSWEFWRLTYAGARHYLRAHPGVSRWLWQMYNEPDAADGTSKSDFLLRLQLASDALTCAEEDHWRQREVSPPPRLLLGPVLASMSLSQGDGGWQPGGWAEAVVKQLEAKPSLLDGWAFHSYNQRGSKLAKSAATVRALLAARGADRRKLPLHVSEFSARSHRQFAKVGDSIDAPFAFARLGAQIAALLLAGADGAWPFRLTQMPLPARNGPGVKLNGLLRLSTADAEQVAGPTRGFEVVRLFSRLCMGGQTLLSVQNVPAVGTRGQWRRKGKGQGKGKGTGKDAKAAAPRTDGGPTMLACRDRTRSARRYAIASVLSCEDAGATCQAGEASVSVDVRGWGVADGSAALLTEVSAHVTGGVRRLRVSGGMLRWTQPAESVQLVELTTEELHRSTLYAEPAAAAAAATAATAATAAAAAAPRPTAKELAAIAAARPPTSDKADVGSCGNDGTCDAHGSASGTAAGGDGTCAAGRGASTRRSLDEQCDAAVPTLPSAPPGWPSLKKAAAFHAERRVTCSSPAPRRLFTFDLSPLRAQRAADAAPFVLLELHGQAFEGGATALVLYADGGRAGEQPRPLGSWRRSDKPCSDDGRCSGTLLLKTQLTIDVTDAVRELTTQSAERVHQRLDVLASCEHARGKARGSRASVKAAALRVLHTPSRD